MPVEKFLWLQKSYESIQHQTLVLLWARNAAKSLWQKERARKKHHLLLGWTCIYERKINCLCHFETGHTFVLREKKIDWSNVWAAKLTRNDAILLTSHLPFLSLLYCVNETLQLRQMMFFLFHGFGYACVWALVSEYICTVYTYVCVCLYEFIAQRLFWFCRWTFAELWSKTCFWLNISLIIHNNMCYCYCFVFIFLASLLHFFALALGHWFGVRWCYFSSLMRYRCLADRICVRVAITLFYVAIHFYLSAQFHQISMCFCIFILL